MKQPKMCITAQQALKFKELGINQKKASFLWGILKSELPDDGDNGYYHLLFFRNQDESLIYLCPERDYGHIFNMDRELSLDDYAAAYTADELAAMLDFHIGDIVHDEDGELLDQTTYQIIPYSDLVHAMADRILINLTIGEYSAITLNELLSRYEQ